MVNIWINKHVFGHGTQNNSALIDEFFVLNFVNPQFAMRFSMLFEHDQRGFCVEWTYRIAATILPGSDLE